MPGTIETFEIPNSFTLRKSAEPFSVGLQQNGDAPQEQTNGTRKRTTMTAILFMKKDLLHDRRQKQPHLRIHMFFLEDGFLFFRIEQPG